MSPREKTDLSSFENSSYDPGAPFIIRGIWYVVSMVFFQAGLFPVSSFRKFLLNIFGAKIGRNVVIRSGVRIKYPWFLKTGNGVWIGEKVWIDNLCMVTIGNNVCISQGAFLLTGNHDYSNRSFDLFVKEIILEEGVWLGAKTVVCPGVRCKSHSVLGVGAVAVKDLDEYSVYAGNPAVKVRERSVQ